MKKMITKPIKAPIIFKKMIEDADLQRLKMGKQRKLSIPKALDRISKHKFFPQILQDYVQEDFK